MLLRHGPAKWAEAATAAAAARTRSVVSPRASHDPTTTSTQEVSSSSFTSWRKLAKDMNLWPTRVVVVVVVLPKLKDRFFIPQAKKSERDQ